MQRTGQILPTMTTGCMQVAPSQQQLILPQLAEADAGKAGTTHGPGYRILYPQAQWVYLVGGAALPLLLTLGSASSMSQSMLGPSAACAPASGTSMSHCMSAGASSPPCAENAPV